MCSFISYSLNNHKNILFNSVLELSSEVKSLWTLLLENPSIMYIYSIFTLYLPFLHYSVINGGTQGWHQAVGRNSKAVASSLPRLQTPCTAPSLTSFYSITMPLVSVFCPPTGSPSISARDTWQRVLSVLPLFYSSSLNLSPSHLSLSPFMPSVIHVSLLHVHLWLSVSLQEKLVLSVISDGRIVSAVFIIRTCTSSHNMYLSCVCAGWIFS